MKIIIYNRHRYCIDYRYFFVNKKNDYNGVYMYALDWIVVFAFWIDYCL